MFKPIYEQDFASLTKEQAAVNEVLIQQDLNSLGFYIHRDIGPVATGIFACTNLSRHSKVRLSTVQYVADRGDGPWIELQLLVKVAWDVIQGKLINLPRLSIPPIADLKS